jgi:hypothetical protein
LLLGKLAQNETKTFYLFTIHKSVFINTCFACIFAEQKYLRPILTISKEEMKKGVKKKTLS